MKKYHSRRYARGKALSRPCPTCTNVLPVSGFRGSRCERCVSWSAYKTAIRTVE